MIYVGIDVAKDKHDCIILNSNGKVVFDVFTIQNNIDGFEDLLFKIKATEKYPDKVKVGHGTLQLQYSRIFEKQRSLHHRNQSAVHQSKPEEHQSA